MVPSTAEIKVPNAPQDATETLDVCSPILSIYSMKDACPLGSTLQGEPAYRKHMVLASPLGIQSEVNLTAS